MSTLLKNTLRSICLIVAGVLLAACSSAAPSESDAKAAIHARIGQCKYFSVDSVTKVNGIPLDDNDYQVEVKYTVSLKPDRDLKSSMKDFSTMYQQLLVQREAYNQHKAALQQAHAGDGSYDPTADLAADKAGLDDLAAKLNANGGVRRFQQAVRQDCPSMRVAPTFLYTYFGPGVTLEQLEGGMTAEFTETLSMIKTDNGWQELH